MKHPEAAPNSDGHYLVDAISLRESFRRHAIAHLKRLRRRGALKLGGKFAHLQEDAAWEAFCDQLASVDWVSFIQPPPTETSSAEQVVRYLTRYLTGGPISDRRIVAADRQEVTFLAREGKQTGGERAQVPVTLSRSEFIRRWCLHIQPDQLTKTRYFGGWCNQRRAKYLQQCRELLESPATDPLSKQRFRARRNRLRPTIDPRRRGEMTEDIPLRCPACDAAALATDPRDGQTFLVRGAMITSTRVVRVGMRRSGGRTNVSICWTRMVWIMRIGTWKRV